MDNNCILYCKICKLEASTTFCNHCLNIYKIFTLLKKKINDNLNKITNMNIINRFKLVNIF